MAQHPGVWAFVDMCMAGLVNSSGQHLKKRSEIWASHELLVMRLRRFICDANHLHQLVDGADTTPTQVGTWPFATAVADSAADLIALLEIKARPALAAWPSGVPQTVDEHEVQPDHPQRKWRCRACRHGIQRGDDRHTRVSGECRFDAERSVEWSCPECRASRGSTAPHTYVPGECRLADASWRARVRGRAEGRDPRIPAASRAGALQRVGPRADEPDPDEPPEASREHDSEAFRIWGNDDEPAVADDALLDLLPPDSGDLAPEGAAASRSSTPTSTRASAQSRVSATPGGL